MGGVSQHTIQNIWECRIDAKISEGSKNYLCSSSVEGKVLQIALIVVLCPGFGYSGTRMPMSLSGSIFPVQVPEKYNEKVSENFRETNL